jgi:hypothetical protein
MRNDDIVLIETKESMRGRLLVGVVMLVAGLIGFWAWKHPSTSFTPGITEYRTFSPALPMTCARPKCEYEEGAPLKGKTKSVPEGTIVYGIKGYASNSGATVIGFAFAADAAEPTGWTFFYPATKEWSGPGSEYDSQKDRPH